MTKLPGASGPLSGKTILILIGGHLATAPRPQKEAAALSAAGARVLIRGVWSDDRLVDEDMTLAVESRSHFAPVFDTRSGQRGSVNRRIRQRMARELFAKFRIITPRLFGPGAPELYKVARRTAADLTIVHSEAGLWVARKLLKAGLRVAVDFEDWFSQDLRPAERNTRPVQEIQGLERELLETASCTFTTSRVLAHALAADAKSNKVPAVIPNCFPAAAHDAAKSGPKDLRNPTEVSFHWFSQTIGPGRGLETLAEALPLVRGPWRVSLRGAIRSHQKWYETTFAESIRQRIDILEPVPNRDLLSRTMSHDVGLALEEPHCPSRDLSATNKIFEYMRAGLAVVATTTRGQSEIFELTPGIGSQIAPAQPSALANAMQYMVDNPQFLFDCRVQSEKAARHYWDWDLHRDELVRQVCTLFANDKV